MKAVTRFFAGAAVVAMAAGGFAAPAAAQYYPGYPGYGGYGTGNVVGQVIDSILGAQRYGYGNYGYNNYGYANDRMQIDRCAAAVEQRINRDYGYRYGAPYDAPYGGYGAYGYQGSARVLGITRVERRSNTTLRVRGVATAQATGYNQPYGAPYGAPYGGQYGGPYGSAYGYNQAGELTFKCDIDYRGYIRDIDLDRNNYAYGYRRY